MFINCTVSCCFLFTPAIHTYSLQVIKTLVAAITGHISASGHCDIFDAMCVLGREECKKRCLDVIGGLVTHCKDMDDCVSLNLVDLDSDVLAFEDLQCMNT